MAFTIEKTGNGWGAPNHGPSSCRLYSRNKPPELISEFILIECVLSEFGQPKSDFVYRLSGQLFKEDVELLKSFGMADGEEVVMTLHNTKPQNIEEECY